MQLSIKAFAITAAIFWSAALFFVGTLHLVIPDYGIQFLEVVGSIYPGYEAGTGFGSVIIATCLGFIDAGIGAAIFAWLYNLFAKQ